MQENMMKYLNRLYLLYSKNLFSYFFVYYWLYLIKLFIQETLQAYIFPRCCLASLIALDVLKHTGLKAWRLQIRKAGISVSETVVHKEVQTSIPELRWEERFLKQSRTNNATTTQAPLWEECGGKGKQCSPSSVTIVAHVYFWQKLHWV